MADEQDWSAEPSVPVATRYFAGGHATDWCVHTPPTWPRVVTVENDGTGALYVSMGPALTGVFATTDDGVKIAAATGRTFVLADDSEATTPPLFSTYGADGVAHVMRITFERMP